jgi:hypothetical protein
MMGDRGGEGEGIRSREGEGGERGGVAREKGES